MKIKLKEDIFSYFKREVRSIEETLAWCSENDCSDLWIVEGKKPYVARYGKVHELPCVETTKEQWSIWFDNNVSNELNAIYVVSKTLDLSVEVRMPENSKYFGKFESNYFRYRCALAFSQEKHSATFRMIKPYIITFDKITYEEKTMKAIENAIRKTSQLIIFNGATGSGKALRFDTMIPTPKGFKQLKDIKIGDMIYDGNGKETIVLDKHLSIRDKHYRVIFSDGTLINSCDNHLWEVLELNNWVRCNKKSFQKTNVLTSNQIYEIGIRNKKGRLNFAVSISNCVSSNYGNNNYDIDPYWLGCWLGDGDSKSARISNSDKDVINELQTIYPYSSFSSSINKKTGKVSYKYYYKNMITKLKENNLYGNKHIPESYKNGSKEDKIKLIKGIIDTDGYINKKGICYIEMTNENIVFSLREMVCSLGWKASKITLKFPKLDNKYCKNCYRFSFIPSEFINLVNKNKRLLLEKRFNKNIKQQTRNKKHYIIDMFEIEDNSDYYCLSVDSPLKTFLCTSSYIKTHNSTTLSATLNTYSKTILDNSTLITLEDPIENIIENSTSFNVIQQELYTDFKDYPSGVKTVLRQRPNYILIGEMRDKEVITSCIEAVRGGHGVFSTFHAEDVAGTVSRLMYHLDNDINLGYDLITNLGIIVSQKMLKSDNGYIIDTQYMIFSEEIKKEIIEIIFSENKTNIALEVSKLMDKEEYKEKGYVKQWTY